MKIKIIVVGKTKESFLKAGEEEFLTRLKRYINIEWVVVKQEKVIDKRNELLIMKQESECIWKNIGHGEWIVVLDKCGNQLTSVEFDDFFRKRITERVKYITFVIGGPVGLDSSLFKRCNFKLSLSKMTFTHDMIRMVLLEQIYRAFTIMNGEKYHK